MIRSVSNFATGRDRGGKRVESVARGWAMLDLAVTSSMAVPPSAAFLADLILALSGEPKRELDGLTHFFLCLAGVLGVLWALARIHEPTRFLVAADAIGRLVVSALIVGFIGFGGAPIALAGFVATEVAGSVHQFLALRRSANAFA